MPGDQRDPEIRTDVPHSARIWNYWMGGKDNYAVDREAGDASAAIYPDIRRMARQSRRFLIRAVRFLAGEAGIRQFLDIGTGLPVEQNTHEVAQGVAPESKIVYVDNDPLVLAHARALLKNTTSQGVTEYLDADVNHPEPILGRARTILDFSRPVAVMFMGVLGHVQDYQDSRRIVATVMDAMPSGSYLCLCDGTGDDENAIRHREEYAKTGAVPYISRSRDQVKAHFDGLDIVPPGFVSITQWRPDPDDDTDPISAYCALARKP
jgi:hypothetical protein